MPPRTISSLSETSFSLETRNDYEEQSVLANGDLPIHQASFDYSNHSSARNQVIHQAQVLDVTSVHATSSMASPTLADNSSQLQTTPYSDISTVGGGVADAAISCQCQGSAESLSQEEIDFEHQIPADFDAVPIDAIPIVSATPIAEDPASFVGPHVDGHAQPLRAQNVEVA